MSPVSKVSRRQMLHWIGGSPLLGMIAADGGAWAQVVDGDVALAPREVPKTARRAIDIFDMEGAAREALSPAHFGYIATGVDGEDTQRNNRAAYGRIYLRPRRLVDVTATNTSVRLFDRTWPTPIVVAPAGSQRAFHPDGELATARAARARGHLQVLSTVSSTAVEQVNEAYGEPVWYQLYATSNWEVTRAVVQRTRVAGCRVLVLTVDLPVGSNRLTQIRWARTDTADCGTCHAAGGIAGSVKPMFRGKSFSGRDFFTPGMTWDIVHRLRDITDQKIVVKGLVTHEDAALALEHGIDGVWVSNHGGRSEDAGRPTIDALPEMVETVAGRVMVGMASLDCRC